MRLICFCLRKTKFSEITNAHQFKETKTTIGRENVKVIIAKVSFQNCSFYMEAKLIQKHEIIFASSSAVHSGFINQGNISNIDTIIDDEITVNITDNMDIKHADINENNKIKQCIIGNTNKETRQQILIGNHTNSLKMLFNIDSDNFIPCLKVMKFQGFYDSPILNNKYNNILESTL